MPENQQSGRNFLLFHWRGLLFVITPVIFCPLMIISEEKSYKCLYLLAIMVVFWISQVIPVMITALLPIVAFPIMGIMGTEQATGLYFRDTFVMFASYLASAIAYSGLHIRLAFRVVTLVGCSPRRLHFGLVFLSMFVSIWVANAVCITLMVPILDVIVTELSEQKICKMYLDDDAHLPKTERRPSRLTICYYLSIAYATSIGGVSILTSSPTDLILRSVYERYFPMDLTEIQYGRYMLYGIPIAVTCCLLLYIDMEIVFMGLFRPNSEDAQASKVDQTKLEQGAKIFNEKYKQLGPITIHEITIILLFLIVIVFFTILEIYGGGRIMNTVPIVLGVILLFSLPANYNFFNFGSVSSLEETPPLITWPFALARVPWNVIFLVGGGTTLAEGSKLTGMACVIGCSLTILNKFPVAVTSLILITSEVILTNFLANVAIAYVTLPIVAEIAITMEINPLYLILATGVSCSMAFILPTGSLPNALVHHEANIDTKYLVLGGILPSITSILVIWTLTNTWGFVLYPMDGYPEWAKPVLNETKMCAFRPIK